MSFINVFFYRLAEHGTDRSGQILIFIIVILLIQILNFYKRYNNKKNFNLFYLILILSVVLVSLKTFYLIYLPIIFIIFSLRFFRENLFVLFFSFSTLYSFLFIFFVIMFNFLNSGCLVYPASFTCFSNLYWSIPESAIENVRQWYEAWAKAGATPSYVVDNIPSYISNFNWVGNWIENYFFNKLSDFLLGLIFLTIIFWMVFIYNTKKINNSKNLELKLIYLYLLVCFFEWFLKHPALRYGGYQLFAILLFLPIVAEFNLRKFNYNSFYKKSCVMIFIVLTIFMSRNVNRIIKEYSQYNFNPFISTNYVYHGGDEKFYNRYIYEFKNNYYNYKKIKILGKTFLITKEN